MNQIWQLELSPQAIVDLKGFDQTERTQIVKGTDVTTRFTSKLRPEPPIHPKGKLVG